MHLIIKNHACYNIMSVIASLIATYKRYALVFLKASLMNCCVNDGVCGGVGEGGCGGVSDYVCMVLKVVRR